MLCRKFSDRVFPKYIQTLSSHQKKCSSHLFSSKLPNLDLETQLKIDTADCRQTFHTYSFLKTVNKENLSLHTRNVHEYIDSPDIAVLEMLKDDFIVYDDFITEEEENSIFQEIEPYLNRLKYEHNHWDDAIHGFRETERKKWTERNKGIIQRVRDVAFPAGVQQLAYVHILDIKKAGYIKPHVDAVRFCGNTIAGISLLSSAVMRLVHTDNKEQYADALLKRRSLYIMRDVARYKFTHEVLGEECSKFKGTVVPRDRRISVICRNEPAPEDRQ